MRSLIAVLSFVVLAAPAQAQDAAPIIAAERSFAAEFPAMGLAGSFQKWSLPDSILIFGGDIHTVATTFAGAPVVRQPGEALIEWWPTFAGVARSGELGFTTGPAARDGERYGHYFTVWRRQSDGSWRWVYDGGSDASPFDQPGPESEPRLLPVTSETTESPPYAMNDVRAAEAALAAWAATDQKAAHLAALAPDGRLLVSGVPAAENPAAFASALERWPARLLFGATEGGGASEAGDMAWTYGPVTWSERGVDGRGRYVRLWQKRPEGWRLVVAQIISAPSTPPAER